LATREQKERRLKELRLKQLRAKGGIEDPGVTLNLGEQQTISPPQPGFGQLSPEEEQRQLDIQRRIPGGALVGGTAGSVIGALSPVPGGAFLGAGAGAAGGEAVQQIIEEVQGKSLFKGREGALQIVKEGAFGLAGEGVGRGILAPLRALKNKALTPFAGSLSPDDLRAIEAFQRTGVQATPFEASGRVFLGRAERFAEQGLISGGMFKRFNIKRLQTFLKFQRELLFKSGPEKTEQAVGEFAKEAFQQTTTAIDKEIARSFGALETLERNSTLLGTKNFKAEAAAMLREESLVTKSLQFPQIKRLALEISKLPDQMTFKQARAFQKRLGAKIARLKNIPEGEMKRLFKGISDDIDALETQNPELIADLTSAKNLYKEAIALDELALTTKIEGRLPEEFLNSVFKKGSVTEPTALRNIVGEQDWPIFQRAFIQKMVGKRPGDISSLGNRLLDQGDDSLRAILSSEQIQALQDMAIVAERSQLGDLAKGFSKAPGFTLINMAQGGLAINMFAGAVDVTFIGQGLLFLTPPMIAGLLTSRTGAKLLSVGMRMQSSNPQAARVLELITNTISGLAGRKALSGEQIRSDIEGAIPIQELFTLGDGDFVIFGGGRAEPSGIPIRDVRDFHKAIGIGTSR